MNDKEAMAMALKVLECANSLNRDYENEIAARKERVAQRTEQNFCSRCGKRTKDLTHIHTCTPPKEGT